MRLNKEDIEAIMDPIIRPSETQEIMARIDAEEEFRVKLQHMRRNLTFLKDDLFDCKAQVAGLTGKVDLSGAQVRCDLVKRQLREHELQIAQLLDECLHVARWSDGTCHVCGDKA